MILRNFNSNDLELSSKHNKMSSLLEMKKHGPVDNKISESSGNGKKPNINNKITKDTLKNNNVWTATHPSPLI